MVEYLEKEVEEEVRRSNDAGGAPSFFSERKGATFAQVEGELDSNLKQTETGLMTALQKNEGTSRAHGEHSTAFALLRDFRMRYGSALWLRRRGMLGKKAARIQETAVAYILEGGES